MPEIITNYHKLSQKQSKIVKNNRNERPNPHFSIEESSFFDRGKYGAGLLVDVLLGAVGLEEEVMIRHFESTAHHF